MTISQSAKFELRPCLFASLTKSGPGSQQLSLDVHRGCGSVAVLSAEIDSFIADCFASGLCCDMRFDGMQNWNDTDGRLRSQLYFSVFSSDDGGSGEKGKGISSPGSAAYAKIWDMYASSWVQRPAIDPLPRKITI